jgi:hypothetical protein
VTPAARRSESAARHSAQSATWLAAQHIEVQSFGAGVQSVALAILNATGRVTPRADLAIFADPGSEEAETYRLLPIYAEWMAAHGYELVTVRSRRGPMVDYLAKSTVIPVFRGSDGAPGRRQCTGDWKIAPVNQETRRRFAVKRGGTWITQLGISIDEVIRAKVDPTKRYPLIELGLSRADCRSIIEAEGLPVPPKSACWFCPFQSRNRWQWRAIERPAEFEAACRLEEDVIRKREPNVYLTRWLQPLRTVVSGDQLTLDDAMDGQECEGVCFV